MTEAQYRITLLAEEIFGRREKAAKWLHKPRRTLGDISDMEASATLEGYAAAVGLLEKLRHGFAS